MATVRKKTAESMTDLVVIFDNSENWGENGRHCIRCAKKIQGVSCAIPTGRVCIPCAESIYRDFAGQQEIAAWHHSRFIHVLSGHESLRWRITVLIRYKEAVDIATAQKTANVETLHRALITNLGCLIDHPLNPSIRQMAVHAVIQFGKPILPILLENRSKRHPWQFYFNMVLCASTISPEDTLVHNLIETAVEHPVETVRNRVISIISSQKSAWAKHLIERLKKKGHAVGKGKMNTEADVQNPPQQQPIIEMETGKPIPIPVEMTPLETVIAECYTLDKLQGIFSRYLSSDFPETVFEIKTKGPYSIKKLTKRQLVWAVGQVFSQKERFDKLLGDLPSGVFQLLYRLTWDKTGLRLQGFSEPLDPPILIETVENIHGRSMTSKIINPDYVIIPTRNINSYRYYFDLQTIFLYFPDPIRSEFKKFLPPPDGYHLVAMDTLEKTDFVYTDENDFLNHLHLIDTYIAQGNLKYGKNSSKVLKTSLKEMAAYCQIREFFPENPEMAYLKTMLIIDFLHKQPKTEMQRSPKFLKQIFDDFFTKAPAYGKFFLNQLLFHLRGIYNLIGGYHEQSHQKNELNVRSSLLNLLRSLTTGSWYSVEKLIDYCQYHDIDLDIVSRTFASSYLSVEIRDDSLRYEKYRTESISDPLYREALEVPFFKGAMFFLAIFGIVDLAYDFPKNKRIQKKDLDYLSVFDGARYIRLTPLGAYIIGTARNFTFHEEKESANLELDDKRLLITLDGKDRLKSMIIGQIAEKISENCFKVTSGSFLKSCTTPQDIQARIAQFRKEISAKPPHIWEDFLKDIQGKIDPLIPEPDMHVFRLKEHPELIELMAMDEILQKLILKAEDYHVIIPSQHVNKVRKRLESFGYLNHTIR